MIVARANHTGAIANYFREGLSDINTVADSYRTIEDRIIAGDSGKRPIFRTNDDLGVEATVNRKSHNKLFFSKFYEGTALPSLFANESGYFLSDFSQPAYYLSECFSETYTKLTRITLGGYSKENVKIKAVGNLIGSVNSSSLPSIENGFVSCIITRSGLPYYYVRNDGQGYYISDTVEATTDISPWKEDSGDICCCIIHCETSLTSVKFEKVKDTFLSLPYDAAAFGATYFVESNSSADISSTKVNEINRFLSKTLV